jgi:hypothetical protein
MVHHSLQDFRAGKITELPANISLYSFFPKPFLEGLVVAFGIAMEEGCSISRGRFLTRCSRM